MSDQPATPHTYVPDFVQLSEALGCEAIRVTKQEDVAPAIAAE